MSWVAPRTWVVGEVLTAALLNTHLRDNLLETAPAKATTAGDVFYATAAGAIARLAANASKTLKMNAGGTAPEWGDAGMKRSTANGPFLIPAGPAAGTSVTQSASANTYGAWTQMSASAPGAMEIIGALFAPDSGNMAYAQLDIGVGAGGAEVSIGEAKAQRTFNSGTDGYGHITPFLIPLKVAAGARVACRIASEAAAAVVWRVTLICILDADTESF